MRTIDFSPLYRNTVGFDRFANMVDNALNGEQQQAGYPPYNIERLSEDDYRITVAVAGFTEAELDIESNAGYLTVTGAKETVEKPTEVTTLYRGIAERAFERRFQLADHVKVSGAKLENGLLHIDLHREVPEALKPRKIQIGDGSSKGPKVIESDTVAA